MATKRANEPWVWQRMEKLSGSKAQCKLCSKQLTCVGGSASGLRHHLTSTHPDGMSSGKPSPQESVASFCVGPWQCNDARQEKITSLVTKVIVSIRSRAHSAAASHGRTESDGHHCQQQQHRRRPATSETTEDGLANCLFAVPGKVNSTASTSVRLRTVFDYHCGDRHRCAVVVGEQRSQLSGYCYPGQPVLVCASNIGAVRAPVLRCWLTDLQTTCPTRWRPCRHAYFLYKNM